MPENYLDTYLDNINRVTRSDVLRIAEKYYKPENFLVTIVGPDKIWEKEGKNLTNRTVKKFVVPE